MSALTDKEEACVRNAEHYPSIAFDADVTALAALVRRLAARCEELEGLLLRECLAHDHLAVHGKTMPGYTHEEWKQIRARTPSEGNDK